MTREEAEEYAKNMTYRDAVCNALQGKCVPYRKATLIKLYELLDRLEQEPCDVFDKYGNYKYPSDVELTEPNTATSMPCEDIISREDVVDILLNEMECVQRASDDECDRDCIKCDLLRDTDKILQAYRMAIKALEHPEKNVVAIVPCGDCISREDALMALTGEWPLTEEWTELTDKIIHRFIKRIKALPSVNPQQEIIRCGQCKYAEVADPEDSQDGYTCPFHRGSIWFSGSYCSWAERR